MDLSQTGIENAQLNSKLINCLQKSKTCLIRDILVPAHKMTDEPELNIMKTKTDLNNVRP